VSGLWLASYVVLWVLVIAMCLLLIGVLRQIGLLQPQREARRTEPEMAPPAPENDGPAIGSLLPDVVSSTVNGFGQVALAAQRGHNTLLMFISPMCETCQHVVEPLNTLAEETERGVRPFVIMRADEHAGRAFHSVFPLRMPLICDEDRKITMGFGVHTAPYGLLYDARGTLIGKGIVTGREQLMGLLQGTPMPAVSQAQTSPPAASPEVLPRTISQ
jgi:methylamine dehydrogenase accessory protein MauD